MESKSMIFSCTFKPHFLYANGGGWMMSLPLAAAERWWKNGIQLLPSIGMDFKRVICYYLELVGSCTHASLETSWTHRSWRWPMDKESSVRRKVWPGLDCEVVWTFGIWTLSQVADAGVAKLREHQSINKTNWSMMT